MAPDDLKFVRMEARLQEQQQQLMAELGIGASDASRASGKVQAHLNHHDHYNQQKQLDKAPISDERAVDVPREPIVANKMANLNEADSGRKRRSELDPALTDGVRKVSYGACEILGARKPATTSKGAEPAHRPGCNKLQTSCELAQFDRSGPAAPEDEQDSGRGAAKLSVAERANDCPPTGGSDRDGAGPPKRTLVERLAEVVPCFGIVLALSASVCLGTAGMLVKLIDSVHGIEVAVLRALIQLVIYVSIICVRQPSRWLPERKEMLPVVARALLGGASITFSYGALKLIPLGDATTIRFSLPIWTLIMGYFLLGEPCSFYKLIAVVISLAGVVLVAKPDDCVYLFSQMVSILFQSESQEVHPDEHSLKPNGSFAKPEVPPDVLGGGGNQAAHLFESSGALLPAPLDAELGVGAMKPLDPLRQFEGCSLALASSVCLAMSIIALRMCKQSPPEVIILWLSLSSATIGSLALWFLGEWSTPSGLLDCSFILLNGLCGALGQWFMTSALKVEQSGLVSLVRTFDIEVAFLYSALLLGEQILATSIVGSILVSLGVIIVLLQQLCARDQSRPADADSLSTSETDSTYPGDEAPALAVDNGKSLDGRSSLADALVIAHLKRKLSERLEMAADKSLV